MKAGLKAEVETERTVRHETKRERSSTSSAAQNEIRAASITRGRKDREELSGN